MSLFVPILRLCLIFFNIYGTFKTLKPPRPSSRSRSGLPSQASVMQRKRDLKGCLAIWAVWTCMAVYERHFEGIISLFIPFYDEFKAMMLIFMMVTRAKGAEPIFLHVLRPLLRPYTATIDTILDILRMIGDIIFALLTFFTRSASDLGQSAHQSLPPSVQALSPFTYLSAILPVPRDPYTVHNARQAGQASQNGDHPEVIRHHQPNGIGNGHPIYPYSPANNIEGLPDHSFSPLFTPAGLSLPIEIPADTDYPNSLGRRPSSRSSTTASSTPGEDAWQWDEDARQYPGFPSAYPPTPLNNNANLPQTRNGKGMRLNRDPWRGPNGAVLEGLAEEDGGSQHHEGSSYHGNPSENRQGFHKSLLPPRKPLNPGYEKRSMSDELTGEVMRSSLGKSRLGHEHAYGLGRFAGRTEETLQEGEDSESDVGDVERDREALEGVGAHEDMDVDMGADGGGFTSNSESELDSDGSFNVTLQTPRVPLPASGSAASIMTLKSTVRTRASARSLFGSGTAVYPSPLSVMGESDSRRAEEIEEEGDEGSGNGNGSLSSRSSPQARATVLTTSNGNGSTHTLSSGSDDLPSSVSVSSLEAGMEGDRESEQDDVHAGQKRSHGTFAQQSRVGPSLKVGTVRTQLRRRTGRLARAQPKPEVERLATEDEGSSSRSSSVQGRPVAKSLQLRSKGTIKGPKASTVRAGIASSNTLPLRKRRKVDDIGPHTSDPSEGEPSVANSSKGDGIARKASAGSGVKKQPAPQRSANTSIVQPDAATITRSSSRLRRGPDETTGTSLQP
ncbi:hypothetical protein PM082_005975 [Marasmius tenuissimus]|nr:hypothetical protein PM082_005975 [Marasmius tenuissimus]